MRNVVIVGGGTAGWMAAAALSKVMGTGRYTISLVESDDIGTVGVGEATIPLIQQFNEMLEIDENAFMKAVNATFKLGIEFVDWKNVGSRYFHPFGVYGVDMNGINFTHYWLRYLKNGGSDDFGAFNPQTMAARQGRFGRTAEINLNIPPVNYAFHFDASLYAKFLRSYCEGRGVTRLEGLITSVAQDAESGDVTSIRLSDGQTVSGDLFIDCSGFRGLLIEQTLKAGYQDWSQWLPCNRAVAVPCDKVGPATPFTRSTAQEAGWQWRIPLQHRTGNGYVFCDTFLDENRASDLLMARLDGRPQGQPRMLRFVSGHRRQMWKNNVVAMGLASGFLEPLESTSIHLVQEAIMKLIKYFPNGPITHALRDNFNREMLAEYDNVKDFLIAHYKVTDREDTPFWAYCKHMDIPDSLKIRLDAFCQQNIPLVRDQELFKHASWFSVLVGQGMTPTSYHPIADQMPTNELVWRMDRVCEGTLRTVKLMPSHEAYVARVCQSSAYVAI